MRNVFIKFLQSDREAKQIIEDYNKSLKLEDTTKELGEKEEFKFVYQGKQIDTSTKSLPQLRVFQRRLNTLIKDINAIKEPTAEDIANKNNYTIVVNDLEKLIATRAKKGMTPELQEAINKIQELKDKQGEIEQSPAGYMIDGEVYKRVTRVIQELKGDKYEYTNAKDVATAFYLTIGDTPLTGININEFIQELRSRSLSGFSEFTYNELQQELTDELYTTKSKLTSEDLLNKIQQVVSEKTYEESRISGNYIDEQIKRLFEGNKPIEFNEKNITQEAFDDLFGEKGFLTALKKRVDNGEIYIVSQGIRVFDKELKIAGEIDLLVADTSGKITIVDVKTGEKSKWDNFKKKNNPNSKMEDYQLQQTAYANLLNRMIGVNPNIALLPVQMTREKETGRITSAGKPTSPTLLSSDFLIALSKADVQDRINSIIPMPGAPLSSITVEPVSVVPTDAESSDDTASPTESPDIDKAYISPETEFDLTDFQKELDKVNDMAGLLALKDLLESKVIEGNIAFDNLEKMSELMIAKKEEIDNNAIKIVPTSLQKDSQFVAKTTIFTPTNEVFAKENDTVIIESINETAKTVTVSNLGTSAKQEISFDNLNLLFNLKETIMGATNPTETPTTSAEKSMVNESTDLTDQFIKNSDDLDRIEKASLTKTTDALDKELLDDLDC
jgi:Holliday junction resolvase-like predicted endonuclease